MKNKLLGIIILATSGILILTVSPNIYSALLPLLTAASIFFTILLAYSAWRLSLISHGFKRAAAAASGGFGAFLSYLAVTDEHFKRARVLLMPLAAALFVAATLAALLMRMNRRGRVVRRRGRS